MCGGAALGKGPFDMPEFCGGYYRSMYLSACRSIRLYVRLLIRLYIYLSMCMSMSVSLSVCLCVCVSGYLFTAIYVASQRVLDFHSSH